ncbi:MAG: DUF4337 domain-containing protein [Sulfurifustaceae bacterium]
MSHGVHVHAPHDHEVEHRANHGPGLAQYVAIFTAVLATIGAVVGYHVATTLNEAMLYKNEAVLKKTEASDQWNYYQAKSTKGNLAQLAADLSRGTASERYRKDAERYEREKQEIKRAAEALEAQSAHANAQSERLLHPLHRAEQSLTLFQIAISLASITVLTRKKWLFGVAGVAAALGLLLATLSAFGF